MTDVPTREEHSAPVDVHEILDKLASLPISTWNYKSDDPSIRHIGPMSQDFAAAFGAGDSDKHIHIRDAMGVAFAAIQALNELVESRTRELAALKKEVSELRSQIRALSTER
ncbi:MAG: tail fiber domain-containing protein [Lentisphaerae bacterium]|nr:tail fiber domain-containing protein [Lentisphaerota bacterium]